MITCDEGVRGGKPVPLKENTDIAIDIADLKALSANGTIKAAEVASGANRLSGLSLVFDRKGPETDFDLKEIGRASCRERV